MEVVAAVIEDARGRLLLAQRPPSKADAGLWEFPGGKVEAGEAAYAALARELREELAIEVLAAARFMRVRRARASGLLTLQAWRVSAWHGEPVAHEHAALRWCAPHEAQQLALCDADIPIARIAQLPRHYAITPTPRLDDLAAFYACIESALKRGLRLLQWRAPQLEAADFRAIDRQLRMLAHAHGARLIVNADLVTAHELGADGVHLSAQRMRAFSARPPRDANFLIAASCHDRDELEHAEAIGADVVVVSAVRATSSHPGVRPLGWQGLRDLLEATDLPAYALGGVAPADIATARACGAIGVAGISAFW